MLHWGFFGVLSLQIFLYYLAFPNDPRSVKLLVVGVYLIEATQVGLLTQSAFHEFAEGFGNITLLDEIGTIWFSVPIMGGIVGFIVQSFYAYRIRILSQSKIVTGCVLFLAFFQLGGAIATGVESKKAVFNSRFLGKSSFITLGIWNGGSALCDAIIAICMTIYLSSRKDQIKETTILVNRVIRLTIETGTFTALIAILNLALSLLPGHPTYYQAVVGSLGKVYSNSMMVSLNSRVDIVPNSNQPIPNEVLPSTYTEGRSTSAYEMHTGKSFTRTVSLAADDDKSRGI
ncbi:hypothetical protein GALMADRAFT_240773 [Galerina marginata CBS 339.88]|uniref:DUF6534 domain-containing protein n=1 Tax=Galerina marginata (strain CBS 339.88) TaxID=685588 RepID=A0A067TQS3_GALM3|nr:hypothetical protein GALMADRAFT_240773 [Galerina marginata CBS 339.88]